MRPLVLLFLVPLGCGSSSSESPSDASKDGPDIVRDAGPGFGTTGKACTKNDDCTPADAGDAGIDGPYCSSSLPNGSLNPVDVCLGAACDPGDGTLVVGCDRGAGVCLPTERSGICLPACDFEAIEGLAPVGCEGKNVCNVYGWGKRPSDGKVLGVGYCLGGCRVDADCPSGQKCQVEEGQCRKSLRAFTKSPGEACTRTEGDRCNCIYTSAGKGYCSLFCRFGVDACPAGFTCDAMLPKTGEAPFAKVPAGIAAYCLKDCGSDADCASINAHCDENAGTGKKTCQPGPRT